MKSISAAPKFVIFTLLVLKLTFVPLVLGKDAVYEVRPAPYVVIGIAFQPANIAPTGALTPFPVFTGTSSNARLELSKANVEPPRTRRIIGGSPLLIALKLEVEIPTAAAAGSVVPHVAMCGVVVLALFIVPVKLQQIAPDPLSNSSVPEAVTANL